MERIRKALERARDIRENQAVVPHNSGQNRSPILMQHRNAGDTTYQETQSIQVSNKELQRNGVVAGLKDNPLSDVFRILRTKVIQRMQSLNMNTLAITSPTPDCGKSLISSNLAVSIALDVNYSVLLVDLDLRQPSLQDYFGGRAKKGISDYLMGDVSFSDTLINPGINHLVVLSGGSRGVSHSSELLGMPKMKSLMEEMKQRYSDRIIIFDLPPLLVTDDALTFLPSVDCCLLVVEEGVTKPTEVKQCMHLLENCEMLGTILNKSADTEMQHGYYYQAADAS